MFNNSLIKMHNFVLGDYAIAQFGRYNHAKVKIIKDEKGKFCATKFFGFASTPEDKDSEEGICYYVEICQTKRRTWVPYQYLRLAERPRPFYGVDKPVCTAVKNDRVRKRKKHLDYILPFDSMQPTELNPSDNYIRNSINKPKDLDERENEFTNFVRLGVDWVVDDILDEIARKPHPGSNIPLQDRPHWIKEILLSDNEIKEYVHHCWRYKYLQVEQRTKLKEMKSSIKPVYISWCLVCGQKGNVTNCARCPSAFHLHCKKKWKYSISYRKKMVEGETILKGDTSDLCPSCVWGPSVTYGDIVWHKLGRLRWWPAKVLTPGTLPPCLISSRQQHIHHWPLKYYGTKNHSWGETDRICFLLPCHISALDENKDEDLHDAVMEASDDYISVYLK